MVETLNRWSRLLASLGASVIAITYVAGFLVSMLHLARYDVPSVPLLKPQYFLAGAWLFIPIVVSAVVVSWLLAQLVEGYTSMARTPQTGGKSWLGHVSIITRATVPLDCYLLFFLFLAISTAGVRPGVVIKALLLTLLMTGAGWGAWFFSKVHSPSSGPSKRRADSFSHVGSCIFLGALSFGWYVWHFVAYLYPGIPATLGGGQPRTVRFMLKSGQQNIESAAMALENYAGGKVGVFKLAVSTETSFIVFNGTSTTEVLQFSRDAVSEAFFGKEHRTENPEILHPSRG